MTNSTQKGYISLDDHSQNQNDAMSNPSEMAENQNNMPAQNADEMSEIEMEMLNVAEQAFNKKRAEAHAEIDRLYDEMIASAGRKVKGITASIVEEVSGQNL